MRMSDWSSDVCSSDLEANPAYDMLRRSQARSEPGPPPLFRENRNRPPLPASPSAHALPARQLARSIGRQHVVLVELRGGGAGVVGQDSRSEEHTSELQSLMRISYAVFCLKKKNNITATHTH